MLDRRIFRLINRLSNDLSHDWTVAEMASGFDISIPHFQKLFKRETGISPMTYLRDLRLEKFSELLLDGYDPVKVIAAQVGLLDESHLTRDFKNKFGVTPTQARKKQAEEEQSIHLGDSNDRSRHEMIVFAKK